AQPSTVIMLGYEVWQRRFHGDPHILGKTLRISRQGQPLTVVGVMPPGLRFLPCPAAAQEPNYNVNSKVAFWLPDSAKHTKPKEATWHVVARLRHGVSLAAANNELAALAARQAKDDSDLQGITAKAQSLSAELNREGHRILLPLFAAVALLFLLACMN